MSNPYYNHGSFPANGSLASSASMRAELDAITAGFDLVPIVTSGLYVPTYRNTTNITSVGLTVQAKYSRVGNVVTVGGYFGATVTSAGVVTSVDISLPIDSSVGTFGAFSGSVLCLDSAGNHNPGYMWTSAYLLHDAALKCKPIAAGAAGFHYFFSYEVT